MIIPSPPVQARPNSTQLYRYGGRHARRTESGKRPDHVDVPLSPRYLSCRNALLRSLSRPAYQPLPRPANQTRRSPLSLLGAGAAF